MRNRWEGLGKEIKAGRMTEEEDKLREEREGQVEKKEDELKKNEETPQERDRL